jgi:hypothetical protein
MDQPLRVAALMVRYCSSRDRRNDQAYQFGNLAAVCGAGKRNTDA